MDLTQKLAILADAAKYDASCASSGGERRNSRGTNGIGSVIDPKLSWALRHREHFPININKAARAMLLRIPGLGGRNVDRILQARRWTSIRLADLARLKVSLKKIMPFIETADHTPKVIGPDNAKENLWLTYYVNIFNPARVKVKAMQKEMPKKYWHNLPEAELISPLLKDAPRRTKAMLARGSQETGAPLPL